MLPAHVVLVKDTVLRYVKIKSSDDRSCKHMTVAFLMLQG